MPVIHSSVPRNFGEILGGLMGAVIDAQAQAARATVDFIEDVGTLEGSDGQGTHQLRNLSFNYTKNDQNGVPATFTLELPLISLVEIPAISIKTAKFSFNFDVTNTESNTNDENNNTTANKWVRTGKPIKMHGRVNRNPSTKTNTESKVGIQVDVEFEKSSLTIGIERILEMLELSATETPSNQS